ncbi:hypothetical protein F5B20DRAFT_538870 [Whalleya microplaca]|nr:hypothetical protein F5B20DRAFT_538870 [Whalleya microplaca]
MIHYLLIYCLCTPASWVNCRSPLPQDKPSDPEVIPDKPPTICLSRRTDKILTSQQVFVPGPLGDSHTSYSWKTQCACLRFSDQQLAGGGHTWPPVFGDFLPVHPICT